MASDNQIISNPLSPIQRQSPDDRLLEFTKNADSIYNKFSVYDYSSGPGWGIGSQQPFVWITVKNSTAQKSITKYDSQALPFGSTILDLQRMGKFMTSGNGLLFIGTQYLLQQQSAFNETRIYNPISVISATAAQGSTGLIERPTRFLATNGTAGDFVASSLMSFVGIQSKAIDSKPDGVATGDVISLNSSIGGGSNKGLIRYDTGKTAIGRFNEKWVSAKKDVGFLGNLQESLLNKFKQLFPSTSPFLSSNGSNEKWKIRPEYKDDNNGAYDMFLADVGGVLATKNNPPKSGTSAQGGFFDQLKSSFSSALFGAESAKRELSADSLKVSEFHRYQPSNKYLTANRAGLDSLGQSANSKVGIQNTSISNQIKLLTETVGRWADDPQFKHSTERLPSIGDYATTLNTYPSYSDIPDKKNGKFPFDKKVSDSNTTLFDRGFPSFPSRKGQIGIHDRINAMSVMDGTRDKIPGGLTLSGNQSYDVIFFYFFDLVNEKYIPFRATILGLNDSHAADWDEVSYIGRADRLFLYKGFTRDVNFNFSVYASSLKELVPMWSRVNYLVGLTRPAKYTSGGALGQFMYPPMVTLRIGDMYKDQPGIIRTITLTIPEDATWETYRGTGEKYDYLKGAMNGVPSINYTSDVLSLQLPTKIDVSIQMSLMEKDRSLTSDDHFSINESAIGFAQTPSFVTGSMQKVELGALQNKVSPTPTTILPNTSTFSNNVISPTIPPPLPPASSIKF